MIMEITDLDKIDISRLAREASGEGYNMINRLVDDYTSGVNRFDGRGEKLIGYIADNTVAAVCGLNIEPTNNKMGRIRRLYVLPNLRRMGLGTKLVQYLISHAKAHFEYVVVNIGELPVAGFYNSMGFQTADHTSYTHILRLKSKKIVDECVTRTPHFLYIYNRCTSTIQLK